MFERIKAYKKLKEVNDFLEGARAMAKLTGDEKCLMTLTRHSTITG